MGEDGYEELIAAIAINPSSGDLIAGTGGFRKLRWKRPGAGKSGGVRVVYFFYSTGKPISMLAIYGKNEKANLSKAERNELQKLSTILKGE